MESTVTHKKNLVLSSLHTGQKMRKRGNFVSLSLSLSQSLSSLPVISHVDFYQHLLTHRIRKKSVLMKQVFDRKYTCE